MPRTEFDSLRAEIAEMRATWDVGRVTQVDAGHLRISGLENIARIGDQLRLIRSDTPLEGEVLALGHGDLVMQPDGSTAGVALDDPVILLGPAGIAPSSEWLGRVIDPSGLHH